MTCLLTSDQLKKKPPQTSLPCVLLWGIRQGTSFPAVLSSLPHFSSLQYQVLQFATEMMNCLRKFQLPKTPSHPELESVALSFSFMYRFCNYKLSSPLCSSFRFHFSPAWQEAEVGISITFTSSPSPHISGHSCFSLHHATQNLTRSWLDKATVLLSKGLIAHWKVRWIYPQTSVAFYQSHGHSTWGKQPEWLNRAHQDPAVGTRYSSVWPMALKWYSIKCGHLIWPRSPKPSHFYRAGAGGIHFALHACQGNARWNTKSSHRG